jgi:hypothetical protein
VLALKIFEFNPINISRDPTSPSVRMRVLLVEQLRPAPFCFIGTEDIFHAAESGLCSLVGTV